MGVGSSERLGVLDDDNKLWIIDVQTAWGPGRIVWRCLRIMSEMYGVVWKMEDDVRDTTSVTVR